MNLKTICMNNIVQQIKSLPLLLKEEVIQSSIITIREEERKKVIKDINKSASCVIHDITDIIIKSYKSGKNWKRPEYTKNIDDDLYNMFVDISQNFVDKHAENLCFRKRSRYDSDEDSDEECDEYY